MSLEKTLNIFKSGLKNTVNLKRNKLKLIMTKQRFFSSKKSFFDDIFLKKRRENFYKNIAIKKTKNHENCVQKKSKKELKKRQKQDQKSVQ